MIYLEKTRSMVLVVVIPGQ